MELSEAELDKLYIIKQVKSREVTQAEASRQLNLSTRQVRRILVRFKSEGPSGIKSRRRGGNRLFSPKFKDKVMSLVKDNYYDFGPTFAAEKLEERDGLKVSKETLRIWMIEQGIWKGRVRKRKRTHQSRERRPRFGELVQIDGSHHDWFEGRSPKCCLYVFIDDATSQIIHLHFDLTETTCGYMHGLQSHVLQYGRPLAYYSDRHSIFTTSAAKCEDRMIKDTQFHRALRSINIELICARSPQAKGRVERANHTLQDRLIKEMRLAGVNDIHSANDFAKVFIKKYNKKFAVLPQNKQDAHQPLHHSPACLEKVCSIHTPRKLSKNLEFSLHNQTYQIITSGSGYHLRYASITVIQASDGSMHVEYKGQGLAFKKGPKRGGPKLADDKEINSRLDRLLLKYSPPFNGDNNTYLDTPF